MRQSKLLLSALVAAALAGGGLLYAQAPDGGGDDGEKLPEVSASGETEASLSPREMASESDRLIKEMEAAHVRVLELQAAARKAKDVIKLNCVNEKLLAVKQLLNIADSARTDLTEAVAGGDSAQQLHDYGQVKLAHERTVAERDEAEGCIGEEIIFVGPTQVTTDGPDIPDDPTDDPDDPFTANAPDFERPGYASPWN
jgi:hypothetical protein